MLKLYKVDIIMIKVKNCKDNNYYCHTEVLLLVLRTWHILKVIVPVGMIFTDDSTKGLTLEK